jgi:hypothetical protein
MVSLDEFKKAGIKQKKGTLCVDWFKSDVCTTILSFSDRDRRVMVLRKAIKKMKIGDTISWKKGTKTFRITKENEVPKSELKHLFKFGFTPHKRNVIEVCFFKNNKPTDCRNVVMGKWQKDRRWHNS